MDALTCKVFGLALERVIPEADINAIYGTKRKRDRPCLIKNDVARQLLGISNRWTSTEQGISGVPY